MNRDGVYMEELVGVGRESFAEGGRFVETLISRATREIYPPSAP